MTNEKIILAAVGILFLLKWAQKNEVLPTDPEDQTGSLLDVIPEDFEDMQNQLTDNFTEVDEDTASANASAFLWTIRMSEGTAGSDGYAALFGYTPRNGKTFSSYAAHPKIFYDYRNQAGKVIKTSAAGAYQITYTTYSALCRKYGYSDFSPETQDEMALALIKERGALEDVRMGRFAMALNKLRKVWASLPDSDVDQPTRSYEYLAGAYTKAGGTIA